MEITEVKQLIDTYHAAGKSRDDTVAIVSAIPINGEASEAFEYIDLIYQTNRENVYIITGDSGKQSLDIEKLINDLLTEYHFAALLDTEEILIYQEGYYQPGGGKFIKAECQRRVGVRALLTEHKINEVIGHITRSTYTDRALFNTNKYLINLTNGLLDVRTRKLSPHSPQFISTIRIPVKYDPTADCPAVKKFLHEVHNPADIPIVQEEFGYILIPDNTVQKAILKVGQGGEGKSTELNLERAFVGKDNCSNVSWHKLELNRFALSTLEGKLVNIFADLPSQSLNMTTAFKMLTGGDAIGGERKFKDQYSFTNFARLIFSTNKPPKIYDDDSYAFWRRWVIIEFPNQIAEDKRDKNILEKLTTGTELSGLLNWAIDGLDRLLKQQGYSYAKSVEETTEYYLRAADPVYAFLIDKCEANSSGCVSKDDLYNAFVEYAKTNSIPILKPNAFGRALSNQVTIRIRSARPIIEGKRVTAWEGLNLVRDVKDVNVSVCIKSCTHGNTLLNKGKNINNPDNPDGELPDCPVCGLNEWVCLPIGDFQCRCGHILKGGKQC